VPDEVFDPVIDEDLPSPGRRTFWRPAVGAAVIAMLAVAAIVVAVRGSHHDSSPAAHGSPADQGGVGLTSPGEPPDTGPSLPSRGSDESSTAGSADSGAASGLVLHDGDTARGQGEIQIAAGHPTLFCPPFPDGGVLVVGPQPYSACPGGIPVVGVDVNKLQMKRTSNGVTTGYAALTGRYEHQSFTVTDQQPDVDPRSAFADNVPCDAPSGGWPKGTADFGGNLDTTAVERYRDTHPGAIVDLGLLRPASDEVLIYVLSAGDPAPIRAALTPTYGQDLCVYPSKYTTAQIDDARELLAQRMQAEPGSSGVALTTPITVGQGWNSDDQPNVDVEVPILTDELARVIDAQPAGLVTVSAWLRPVH
jgi:hypothetical protein